MDIDICKNILEYETKIHIDIYENILKFFNNIIDVSNFIIAFRIKDDIYLNKIIINNQYKEIKKFKEIKIKKN